MDAIFDLTQAEQSTVTTFSFTDPERHFLSHWMYDSCGDFWGPSIIWCWNNRIDWNRAPYPMAELFQK
jgi:hypothetical protein